MKSGRIGSPARRRTRPEERWVGLERVGPGWAWVGHAKKKELGRGPLTGGGRDRGAAAATPLDAAVRAGMDAGDGSGHRRRFAEVDMGLTGVKTVGIGENFGISADLAENRGNSMRGFLGWRGSRAAGERCPGPARPARFARIFLF
ncbi:hypothetical protein CRG98_032038 [Punica granatum]|uniref:Uncharacterized protein n=1 Tax=Punica granatum TaxID=22663 RepID=A0A2I0IUY1_PUNGR|nr:hypothetical protein CRG98_032038 [Punica granatum]